MSVLEDFYNSVAGSENTLIDFDSRISSSGDFAKLTQLNVILKSWSNILITPVRSYTHDPEYGSELYSYVFSLLDSVTEEEIKNEITYKINLYDNRARIQSILISNLPNRKGFSIKIGAEFKGVFGEISVDIDENIQNVQNG